MREKSEYKDVLRCGDGTVVRCTRCREPFRATPITPLPGDKAAWVVEHRSRKCRVPRKRRVSR